MNGETQHIANLLKEACEHNEHACERLLNLYKGRIFSYVYRMVRNYHDAEDITFDIFIKCFKFLKSFDRSRSFTAWLFSIAHNCTIDFFRKNKQEYEYFDDQHSVPDDFVERFEQKKRQEKIEQALAKMAPLDRELVILFHKEEYSYKEISEIVNLPVTTIKTRLHRARKRLKELVHNE